MQFTSTKIITSLIIYVIIFTIIVCTIGMLTAYFLGNLQNVNSESTANSSFSMLNLYLLKTVQTPKTSIESYGLVDNNDISSYYITLRKQDGSIVTFIKLRRYYLL